MDKETIREFKRLHEIVGDIKMDLDYTECDACGRKVHKERIVNKLQCKVCPLCAKFVRGGFKKNANC